MSDFRFPFGALVTVGQDKDKWTVVLARPVGNYVIYHLGRAVNGKAEYTMASEDVMTRVKRVTNLLDRKPRKMRI